MRTTYWDYKVRKEVPAPTTPMDGDLLFAGLRMGCTCGNHNEGDERGCGACRMYDYLKDFATERSP